MSTKKIPPNRPSCNPAPTPPAPSAQDWASNRYLNRKRELLIQRHGEQLLEALEQLDEDESGLLDVAEDLDAIAHTIRLLTSEDDRPAPTKALTTWDWQMLVKHLGRSIQGAANRLTAVHKLRRMMSAVEGAAVDDVASTTRPDVDPTSSVQSKRASVRRAA